MGYRIKLLKKEIDLEYPTTERTKMKNEVNEKLLDFGILILTVILDSVLILVVAGCIQGVTYLLEKFILKCKIEDFHNGAFRTIHLISKTSLIIIILLYVAWDILTTILNFVRRLKK